MRSPWLFFLACQLVLVIGCSSDDSPQPTGQAELPSPEGSGNPPLGMLPVGQLLATTEAFPDRQGPLPDVSRPVPHQQLTQNAPIIFQEVLTDNVRELLGVRWVPTNSSLPGSQGWFLNADLALGPRAAFLGSNNEFGHNHEPGDGSMHMRLPPDFAQIVVNKRWGEFHPNNGSQTGDDSDYVMVFGPRDADELAVAWIFVQASYAFATGSL